jgi:hypothetical protein
MAAHPAIKVTAIRSMIIKTPLFIAITSNTDCYDTYVAVLLRDRLEHNAKASHSPAISGRVA